MKSVLISHNFNPGHISHLLACKKLLVELGFDVSFRVTKDHQLFSEGSIYKSSSNILFDDDVDLAVCLFPSLKAVFDILLMRIFLKLKVIYIFHEPFTSIKSYKSAGFSSIKILKIFLTSCVSWVLCMLSDSVILPSENAFKCFATSSFSSKGTLIPLFFEDECCSFNTFDDRKYISYIGTIAEDHAFKEFYDFVVYCLDNDLLEPFHFLIATKSHIPFTSLNTHKNSSRLKIVSGLPMTNSEINYFYASSFVVWNAYKRSMQSGVLPKCYMFATPVLVSENNINPFFKDNRNGLVISNSYDNQSIFISISKIIDDWDFFSKNCRDDFCIKFHYTNMLKSFKNIIFG